MKRLRQDAKRRLRNRSAKTRVRTVTKKVRALAAEGKTDEAGAALREAFTVIDKTAQKGIMRHKTASRQKSRLTRAVTRSQESPES
jgi:small subunit ribosomal protein S20